MEIEEKWKHDVKTLEAKYADRGLVFTSPFEGFAPIQAFGHIDGKRFYFRLRGGEASLRVGIYDLAIEVERKKRRNESLGLPTDSSEVFKVPKESDKDLYPTVVQYESYAHSRKLNTVELFSLLLESLEPIPTDSIEKS